MCLKNLNKRNFKEHLPSSYTLQSQSDIGARNLKYGSKTYKSIYSQPNKRLTPHFIIGVVLIFLCLIFLPRAISSNFHRPAEVLLQVHDAEMYVNEEKPQFAANIECKDSASTVVDEKSGLTIQNLIDRLNEEGSYTLASNGDGTKVGEFPIQANLAADIQASLDNEWKDKVKVVMSSGTFRVKEIDEAHAKELADKAKAAYEQPMLALTFDDGPGPYTLELLEALEKSGAHATFFMVGKNVPNFPEAVKKMSDIGCELGNHSYDHAKLTKLSIAEMQAEISQTNEAVRSITGRQSTVLRVPYGATSDAVNGACGMPMIQWSVDTLDWKTRSTEATVENVLNYAEDGDIILMHDIHSTSVEAAKQLIPALQSKGFKLVTVSEMAKARGHKLENGNTYFSFHKAE